MKNLSLLLVLLLIEVSAFSQRIRVSQIEDIQGTVIKSIGETSGKILTTNGSGSSLWQAPIIYAPLSGSGNYIQNQNASAQTANMWIDGSIKYNGLITSYAGSNGYGASGINLVQPTGDVSWQLVANFGAFYIGKDNLTIATISAGTSDFSNIVKGTRLQSTIATGTAPLTVASTTLVSNLNSDLLDGQHGSYYLPEKGGTGYNQH